MCLCIYSLILPQFCYLRISRILMNFFGTKFLSVFWLHISAEQKDNKWKVKNLPHHSFLMWSNKKRAFIHFNLFSFGIVHLSQSRHTTSNTLSANQKAEKVLNQLNFGQNSSILDKNANILLTILAKIMSQKISAYKMLSMKPLILSREYLYYY